MQQADAPQSFASVALLRFSKFEWHSDTLNSEHLRLTPIEDWKRMEGKDNARGDSWENATRIDQPATIKSVKLRFDADPCGQWIDHKLRGPIVQRGGPTDFPATHAICFNMLTNQSVAEAIAAGLNSIDLSKFREGFGHSLLVVENVPKFLTLVVNAIRQLNDAVEASSHGPVKYVDQESYSGAYNIYHKPQRHEWQQEFRIAVSIKRDRNKHISLHIPGLKDVCKLIEDFNPIIQLKLNDDGTNSVSISQIVISKHNIEGSR